MRRQTSRLGPVVETIIFEEVRQFGFKVGNWKESRTSKFGA